MSAPKEIVRLIDQFERNFDSYKSGRYNETQLRREFLDPFFKALGWDVDNAQGLAEAYKDVVHEDAIRIGGAVKAPDYCFRIGGTRKFFLEAKKPSIAVGSETSAAYQLRRYAWSAKLPLSILSDFEEFAVYDCRIKPNKPDSAAVARVFLCGFRDFPEKWDWIASIFSKEAVLKGSFDKYAETNKAKRGTAEVDDDFLATIEHWRSELARNIALRNPSLSQRELNFAVQRIIDRIIFLRIGEDRGIDLYGRLLALTNGPNIYERLCEVFQDADAKYNSGLFHFETEKGRHESPDEITLGLKIDDKLLLGLLKGLYYPESPYEFTVISSDILGQVYEQFLGKIIRLTEGHHAVVEDKPEVKKAGGVYYTPIYIVDYIVKQTVGKLVEGKTPRQVSKLRILDPACGSGSFLINAYQYLLDWHRDWYLAHQPEKWAKGRDPVLVQTRSGWKLTISERKRILLDHIYGVDIDPQAVEVTKLSLLLKVLEGEDEQTIEPFLRLLHQRALPDLGDNIKCGNSLIGPEAYKEAQLLFLPEADQSRINVFDWSQGFPEVIKSGGFDAVIGNPPYIRIQTMKEWAPAEVELYKKLYKSAASGNYDIYVVFVEKALSLLNKSGRMGFILPHKFFNSQYGEPLRGIISS
ncbi:MAG: Eco57I restriction-modification methylase domain-containing protein, partial [Candidatus Aminicenantales bacterium]